MPMILAAVTITPEILLLVLLGALAALLVFRYRVGEHSVEQSFADTLPALIWAERNGQVIWANQGFRELDERLPNSDLNIDLFSPEDDNSSTEPYGRMYLKHESLDEHLHFNLTTHEYNNAPYYYAQSAQETAQAEMDRKRFVKSMTETFAHLPIGVAVFDRRQDLSLFNPALSELLGLAPSWLANQPSLRAFIDRLHDKGHLPEPKDFKAWRDHILELESSEESQVYFDDWNLSNGCVYRITGQSYPRGAVAIFIEDISSQVAVETEYRLEIRRLYNAFDALDSAVVIFSSTGELSFANNSFESLWGTSVSESILVPDVISISRIWQEKCCPTPVWGEIRDFVTQIENREAWQANVTRRDGGAIVISVSPLVDGQTLCEFTSDTYAPVEMVAG